MEFIEIIKPGLMSTIQDLGRANYQKYGISASGAMDKLSLRIGNILVGNHDDEAAIEITLMGPHLKFLESGIIAITGADIEAKLNGEPVPLWTSIKVEKGDELTFGFATGYGCRAYIAIAGGVDVPVVLGSKSTSLRAGFGGINGKALQSKDIISIGDTVDVSVGRIVPVEYRPNFSKHRPIRFILGPQADEFETTELEKFCTSSYKVLNESDRMGFRLEGVSISHKVGPDIISDYITMGSIQIPGNGQPIVLMADCQMTGGYTKIGVVTDVDLPYLAQKKPGDTICFEKINIEEAQQLYKERERLLSLMKVNNRPSK
ncbi:biotin-dependent carboxyltransferase family protein [Lysinibacillus sp. FSL K6-0232]|uniref:5-oxoprolinase subunit C family protein n=1 Tax=Lysinibacillus sp. FSL K6-0232 TaxID=2921425 RepID=UPI0030F52C0F